MKITLYVKGVKTLSGEPDRSSMAWHPSSHWDRLVTYPDLRLYKEAEYKSVLPEDQKVIVDLLAEMSRTHRFDLKIIDLARERPLRRLWQQVTNRICTFPTLISESGERFEGKITAEQIKAFIKNQMIRKQL